MRNLDLLDQFRDVSLEVRAFYHGIGDDTCGAFLVPSPIDKAPMRVIASSEEGWDHVSVSRANRCPNWAEMEHVKRLFFKDDETAVQYHVPPSDHINCHPHCLHLWRSQTVEFPRPPAWMVGPVKEPSNA
jgi:hypothetical protein